MCCVGNLCHKFFPFFITHRAMKSYRKEEKNAEKKSSFKEEKIGKFRSCFLEYFSYFSYFSYCCGEQSFVSTSFVHHHQKPSAKLFLLYIFFLHFLFMHDFV